MKNKYNLRLLDKSSLLDLLEYNVEDNFELEEIINIKILKELGFKYGIIYNFDSIVTERIEDLEIDIENIMEARFFNEKKELRILRDEDEIKGTIFVEKEDTKFIGKTVILYKRNEESNYANHLRFKKYIDYDDDNQAYVRYTKPCKLYFKEAK